VLGCEGADGTKVFLCWSVVLLQLLRFNGTKVLNLQHLAEMVAACSEEQLRFDLEYSEVVIIDRQQAAQGTQEVLQAHSIPAALSADLQRKLQVPWPPTQPTEDETRQSANGNGTLAVPVAVGAAVVAAAVVEQQQQQHDSSDQGEE
jgi:hypothetical protein